MHLKIVSAKWRPFYLGGDELRQPVSPGQCPRCQCLHQYHSCRQIHSDGVDMLQDRLEPDWHQVQRVWQRRPHHIVGIAVDTEGAAAGGGGHTANTGLGSGGHFKKAYQLLNLRALKFSRVNKMPVFQCISKIFCVEFQREPLKFHTKYLTHTLEDTIFIQHWNSKSSWI